MNDALTYQRIGAYGGTFDPIHNGHIEVARFISELFRLDLLLLIVAASPPHKDPGSISSAYHRFAMAALATLDLPRVRVSLLELEQHARPYTFETVGALRRTYGDESAIFFVIGSDSFDELHKWKEPGRILDNSNIIVAARPGYQIAGSELPGQIASAQIVDLRGAAFGNWAPDRRARGGIYLTDRVAVDVSSSEIRHKVACHQSIEGLMPGAVTEYINKYGLYQDADKGK